MNSTREAQEVHVVISWERIHHTLSTRDLGVEDFALHETQF